MWDSLPVIIITSTLPAAPLPYLPVVLSPMQPFGGHGTRLPWTKRSASDNRRDTSICSEPHDGSDPRHSSWVICAVARGFKSSLASTATGQIKKWRLFSLVPTCVCSANGRLGPRLPHACKSFSSNCTTSETHVPLIDLIVLRDSDNDDEMILHSGP